VTNPGLEGPYSAISPKPDSTITGELPDGWNLINGNAEAELAEESANVHEGKSAMRVTLNAAGSQRLEVGTRLKMEKKAYRFTIWLKSDGLNEMVVFARQTGDPYTVYFKKSVKVSPEWAAYTVEGVVGDTDVRFVVEMNKAPAVYWIDDFRVENVSEGTSQSGAMNCPTLRMAAWLAVTA